MLALVIDDEPALRVVCQRLLGAMGHQCEAAANVAEAVELTQSQKFDLIICDYRLGSETARDVVVALQASAPSQISSLVLASGDSSGPDVAGLASEHGLGIISKPFGRAELDEMIASLPTGS